MGKYCFLTFALVASATGCIGAGFSGGPRVAQQSHPQQTQLASAQLALTQKVGFTERITSSLTSIIPGMGNSQPTAPPLKPQKHDPISLGFPSGPPNAALYMSMAKLSDQGGNTDHARSMYQKALSLEPNHRDALLGLARLEDRKGQMNEALKIYQQAATAHPQDAKVLNDLALCYARTGQLPASAQLLDQASHLQPQKKLYRNNFAKVLIEMNRVDEALAQMATVHPPAVAHYNMGVLMNERGQPADAIHFLTAATHIDPQLQPAATLLAQLNDNSNQLPPSTSLATNDNILPTPMPSTTYAAGQPYPTTNSPTPTAFQPVPTETAQIPLGNAPILLPPVR